jgi:hypothetical protein
MSRPRSRRSGARRFVVDDPHGRSPSPLARAAGAGPTPGGAPATHAGRRCAHAARPDDRPAPCPKITHRSRAASCSATSARARAPASFASSAHREAPANNARARRLLQDVRVAYGRAVTEAGCDSRPAVDQRNVRLLCGSSSDRAAATAELRVDRPDPYATASGAAAPRTSAAP